VAHGVLKCGQWVKKSVGFNMLTLKSIASGKRAGKAAFTLVEVMISSMIGAIIFTSLFYAIAQSENIVQYDRENLRATEVIAGKMESLRLCGWTTTNGLWDSNLISPSFSGYFSGTNGIAYSGTVNITSNFTWYTYTPGGTNIDNTPPSYSNSVALITVTLSWSEKHNGRIINFSRSDMTYASAYGMQSYVSTH
jgi:prepilin-type N-terminal cleavage/methylation domain-containing protein